MLVISCCMLIFWTIFTKQASKHIYLSNDRLPKNPLAQQCWQPIVTAQTVKKSAHTKNKRLTSWPLHTDITLQ